MDLRTLVPWTRMASAPSRRTEEGRHPFLSLHRDVNRLFDEFFRGFDAPAGNGGAWAAGWPQVDVTDTGKEIRLVAELPGLEEKDIDITLADGVLTLQGEKKAASEESHYSERWYGRFRRSFQLGPDIDPDKVSATFRNGVLSLTVEKKPQAQATAKRIAING
jgi:HSP20 family protein